MTRVQPGDPHDGTLVFMIVAHLIVASEHATFPSRYARRADARLRRECTPVPEAIGTRRALELTLTARTLTASEVLDWGLVREVVAPEALEALACTITDSWLRGLRDSSGAGSGPRVHGQIVVALTRESALADQGWR